MNILTKFLGAINQKSSDIDRYFLRNLPGGGVLGDKEVLEDPYSNNSLVYTCISTTARAIAQVPLMVVEYDKRDNPVPVASTHPWQKLLNQPNYMMNRGSFLEAVFSLWLLDGNVCLIPFPPTAANKGIPTSLWVVRWKYMKYDKDEKGHLKKWYYRPDAGTSIPLEPSEVLHLKFFNPNDLIAGLAPSEAGKLPIQSIHRASKYNAQFFENGAVPGGILHTDKQLSKSTFERTKQQVNQDYGIKEGNAHKMMVLEQGLKWAATGISQRDMEFIGLHRLNAEEILQLYGMKKSIISITGDLNFATATVERKEWWQGTCMPLMRLFVDTLSFGLFEQRRLDSFDLMFDISSIEALHEAFADKAKTSEILLRLGFTRNEVNKRLEMGFPDVDWGNIAYMPVNMMPVNIPGYPPQAGGPGGLDGDNPNPNNPQDNPTAGPDTPTDPEDPPKSAMEYRIQYMLSTFRPLATPQIKSIEGKIKKHIFNSRVEILKSLSENEMDNYRLLQEYSFDTTLEKIQTDITVSSVQLYSMAASLTQKEEKESEVHLIRDDIVESVKTLLVDAKETILAVSPTGEKISTVKNVFNHTLKGIISLIWSEIEDFVARQVVLMDSGANKTPEKEVETPIILPQPTETDTEKLIQPINLNITITPEKNLGNKTFNIIRDKDGLIQSAEIVEE